MPKVSSDTTEVPKRAPRRRVPRKTTRVATAKEAVPAAATPTVRRKSPTTFATPAQKSPQKKYTAYVPAAVLLVSAVAAVLIGISDAGQIDIQALVANQSTQTTTSNDSSGESTTMTIPVQNNPSTEPGGGLLPSADQSVPIPSLPEASDTGSTTASSTEVTASSTEPVAAEGDETLSEAISESPQETNTEEVSSEASGGQ